jgi:hypothetical protein
MVGRSSSAWARRSKRVAADPIKPETLYRNLRSNEFIRRGRKRNNFRYYEAPFPQARTGGLSTIRVIRVTHVASPWPVISFLQNCNNYRVP